MTTLGGNERDEARRGGSWERWALGISIVVGVIAIVVAVWGVWDARDNSEKIVESQQKIADALAAKTRAEQQATAAETKATQLRAENAKLQSVSITRLLDAYDAHLSAIQKAASIYDEVSKLPDTVEGAAAKKAAAEQQLYTEVASFAKFVGKWRDFARTLEKILDGSVDQMEQASDIVRMTSRMHWTFCENHSQT
jgi:hypothetical protein